MPFSSWDSFRRNNEAKEELVLPECCLLDFEETICKEWLVRFIEPTWRNTRSRIREKGSFSDDSLVQVWLNQGSLLVIYHSTGSNIQEIEIRMPWWAAPWSWFSLGQWVTWELTRKTGNLEMGTKV